MVDKDMNVRIFNRLNEYDLSERLESHIVLRIAVEFNVSVTDVLKADARTYMTALKSHYCPKWISELSDDIKFDINSIGEFIVIQKGELTLSELGLEELEDMERIELLNAVRKNPLSFANAPAKYALDEKVVKRVRNITGRSLEWVFLLQPEIYSDVLEYLSKTNIFEDVAFIPYGVEEGVCDISWMPPLNWEQTDRIHKAAEAKRIIAGKLRLEDAKYDHSDNAEVMFAEVKIHRVMDGGEHTGASIGVGITPPTETAVKKFMMDIVKTPQRTGNNAEHEEEKDK